MSKDMASLLIGIGMEIIVTIFRTVVRTMPMPLAITLGVIGLALIVYGLVSLIRRKGKNSGASQSISESPRAQQASHIVGDVYQVSGDLVRQGKPDEQAPIRDELIEPIDDIIKELESKFIHQDKRYSMLEIFDALRERFALGLTYPQVHGVLKSKLYRDATWGIHSSDILATFTQLGLIHSPSVDPNHSVWLDFKDTIPNYVYQLTDSGKLLAHKLMSQKPKTDKGNYQTE